jgi:transposase-like protein
MREVNEAVAGVYLSGGNTRRIRGALRPLLKNAPLSKSAVSRIVTTLRGEWETWRTQSLADLNVVYLYLDAIALRVRSAGRVTGLPVLAGVAVLSDGTKRLVSLEVCGAESGAAWEGFLQSLIDRGLKAPRLCVIDGNAGLHRAITLSWRTTKIQRCAVHKLRNILRKVPQHAHEEITADFHLIVYASGLDTARAARDAFTKKWAKRCAGAVESLNEAGDDLLTFYSFPKEQWKTIRTTNVIERLNGEFRRRVKTQGSFPTEECALVLLYSLVASGQINLRRLDGYEKIVDVIAHEEEAAA